MLMVTVLGRKFSDQCHIGNETLKPRSNIHQIKLVTFYLVAYKGRSIDT